MKRWREPPAIQSQHLGSIAALENGGAAPKPAVERIEQLDTLRGVAVMLVVLHHTMQAFSGAVSDPSSGLGAFLDVGRVGVVMFFMISGFVIVKAMPGDDGAAAAIFWKHRFFRLYPPFWVSLALAVLVAGLVGSSTCCAFVVPTSPPSIMANATMIPLRLHQPALIGVYWTLELELLFYGSITAITLAHRADYRTMWAASCALLSLAIAAAVFKVVRTGPNEIGKDQLFTTLLHLSIMFSGAAIRYVWEARPKGTNILAAMPRGMWAFFGVLALFFSVVVLIKLRHGVTPRTFRVAATYLLGVAAFLVCLNSLRGSRIGRYFGNRSYGLYLLHVPVLSIVSLVLARQTAWTMSYPIYFLTVSLLSLALADLLRRFVERPAIRFSHRRIRYIAARAPMDTAGMIRP